MLTIYFDASALAKRYTAEEHFQQTRDAIDEWEQDGERLVTSALGAIEISRLAQRLGLASPADMESDCLAGIELVPIGRGIAAAARRIGPPQLRSLDAIHLASAVLTDTDVVVTFDNRLADACRAVGLGVWEPAG